MKSSFILLVVASALSLVNGYKVNCTETYTVKENDKCFKIAAENEISYHHFKNLNPGMDCKNLVTGTTVCVKGKPNFSKKGNGKIPERMTPPDVTIDNYDSKKINDISKVLSINKAKAKKLYEHFNEGLSFFEDAFINSIDNKYSVEQCKDMCQIAHLKFNAFSKHTPDFDLKKYNKFLKKNKKETVQSEDLLNSCVSQCYFIKEMNEYKKKGKESDDTLLEKRANQSCESPSSATITETKNYKNGYSKFRVTKGYTAVNLINGCSIPIIKDLYNDDDRGTFVPACNSHDLCYGCQSGSLRGGKTSCDEQFLTNMKNICKVVKDNGLGCNLLAQAFYAAVKGFAQKNYDNCKNNEVRTSCAYCGAYPIQERLFTIPFYV